MMTSFKDSNSIKNQKLILQKYTDDNGFRKTRFFVYDGYSGPPSTVRTSSA